MAMESGAEAKASQKKLEEKITLTASVTGKSPSEVIKKLGAYHHSVTTAKVLRQLEFAQTLDLLFVYDATGSMGPYIKLLNTHIRGIVEDLYSVNKFLKPRLGLVAYRDPEDGASHFDIYPFDGSVSKFESKLKQVTCEVAGGAGLLVAPLHFFLFLSVTGVPFCKLKNLQLSTSTYTAEFSL
jgi:hypothetical protein